MADTYSQIYIHLVFAVEHRQALISEDWQEDLHRLITKIVKNHDKIMMRINSMPDHVHMLIAIDPTVALADLVREIKTGSARYVNENDWLEGRFGWQDGFGAFSVSKSQVDRTISYIQKQQEHHQSTSFHNEYIQLLALWGVDYDDRSVFDFRE